jgi:uncharacterized protein (TIGR02444 family)
LFFILYFAIHGRRLSVDQVQRIDACTGDWRARVVQPLRTLRRDLKRGIAPIDVQTAQALRDAIKRDELQAERLQQETLERNFPLQATGTPAAPREAAAANIAAYAAFVGRLPDATVNTLVAALIDEFSV